MYLAKPKRTSRGVSYHAIPKQIIERVHGGVYHSELNSSKRGRRDVKSSHHIKHNRKRCAIPNQTVMRGRGACIIPNRTAEREQGGVYHTKPNSSGRARRGESYHIARGGVSY